MKEKSTFQKAIDASNAQIQLINDNLKKGKLSRVEWFEAITNANKNLFRAYADYRENAKVQEPIGIILYENQDIVCLATGFKSSSQNDKTGGMIQTWIIYKHAKPSDALKMGMDFTVCGNCLHRGNGEGKKRTCYVNLGQGPRAAFDAWQRGRYAKLDENNIKWFAGRKVRLGSYGDPAFVPVKIWRKVLQYAENSHTGYTHQWKVSPQLKDLCMASVDTFEEAMQAWEQGWRTFRLTNGDKQSNEITCPASAEMGKRTTCENCGLCAGASKKAKSITIAPHGIGAGHFAGA